MKYLGDFPTGATIYIPFATYDKDDGSSITLTGLAVTDIEIYKNGSTTQRASDAGYSLLDTDGIDFDGITGIHGFSIDTSDNTDAGFWAAGGEYWVIVSSVTVDGVTVNFIAATFSIERSGGALALLKNATYGLSALENLVDDLESRLSAARAGYLDNLSAGAVALQSSVDDLEGRLTAARAGYLDNLNTGVPVASIAANAINAAAIATGAIDADAIADNAIDAGAIASNAITADKIATDAITAAKLAADVATEIQSGLATAAALDAVGNFVDTEITSIKGVTDKLDAMLELDGAVYRYTENALEQAPSGTGGDATAANQTTIINHLTGIKGGTWNGATDSLEAIRDRGDVAWITGGAGTGASTVTINVHDALGHDIPDVSVQVWNVALNALIASNVSDSNGQAVLNLDDGAYRVKLRKAGYNFAAYEDLTVAGNTSDTYIGTALSIGIPAAADLCRVYDFCYSLDGASPLATVTSYARLYNTPYDSGAEIHDAERIAGTYDAVTGLLYWDIVRGASVYVSVDEPKCYARLTVPDQAQARICDIVGVVWGKIE